MPVTRFGVSEEKVQATIDTPSNHQGIPLPPRKNSVVFFPAVLEATHPMVRTITKKTKIIVQSKELRITVLFLSVQILKNTDRFQKLSHFHPANVFVL
jgi:hypothetical protein